MDSYKTLKIGGFLVIILILIILFNRLNETSQKNLKSQDLSTTAEDQKALEPIVPLLQAEATELILKLKDDLSNTALNSCTGSFYIDKSIQAELDGYEASESQGFNNIKPEDIVRATLKAGKQEITIDVDENGFSIPMIVLQKGVQAELNFNGLSLDYCNQYIFLSSNEQEIEIHQGDNLFQLYPEQDIFYQCWRGHHYGYVAVVDDLGKIDTEALINLFNAFEADRISAFSGYGY